MTNQLHTKFRKFNGPTNLCLNNRAEKSIKKDAPDKTTTQHCNDTSHLNSTVSVCKEMCKIRSAQWTGSQVQHCLKSQSIGQFILDNPYKRSLEFPK